MIKPELLSILVCPDCRAPLVATPDGDLVCTDAQTRRLYRVEDGIPVLLVEESKVLEPAEHAALLEKSSTLPANQQARKAREAS